MICGISLNLQIPNVFPLSNDSSADISSMSRSIRSANFSISLARPVGPILLHVGFLNAALHINIVSYHIISIYMHICICICVLVTGWCTIVQCGGIVSVLCCAMMGRDGMAYSKVRSRQVWMYFIECVTYLAALTAISTSSACAAATLLHMTLPLMGLRVSNVFPDLLSTHSLLMKSLVYLIWTFTG
jgi:hypothetical protein